VYPNPIVYCDREKEKKERKKKDKLREKKPKSLGEKI